jgi:hypothetical protein
MASNLDNKYRENKEIKYRSVKQFEKDLTEEKTISGKKDKRNTVEEKSVVWIIEYIQNPYRFIRKKDFSLEYKTLEIEAKTKEKAKEKFEEWHKKRVKEIENEIRMKNPMVKYIWLNVDYEKYPDYSIKLVNIRKKKVEEINK